MEPYLKALAIFLIYLVYGGIIAGVIAFLMNKKFAPKKCLGCGEKLVRDNFSKVYGDWCPNEKCEYSPHEVKQIQND